MRTLFKVIIAVVIILILLVVAFAAVFFLDLAAYTATGSQTLTPPGASVGNALVIYDPGLSGAAQDVANKIAADLQAKGYTVTLAGVKSGAATNTSNYAIIVVGGPIYAGAPTASIKDYLGNLNLQSGTKLGVFGSGQGSTTPLDVKAIQDAIAALKNDSSLSNAIVVKIGRTEDLNKRASDFVNELTA